MAAPFDAHKNFSYGTVLTAPSPPASGTTLVLGAGQGARFPDPSTDGEYNVTVWPTAVQPLSSNAEIVRVTAISTDTLTITRQQEGTSARTILVGDQVALTITTKIVEDIENLGTSSQVKNETPGGAINGTNVNFTTAADYQTDSLRVYLNGQRLKGGGDDYTEISSGFTMVTAPVAGDILLVDYDTNTTVYATGSTSFIYGEQVNETPTGSLAVFTVDFPYVPGSTQVYVDGQLQFRGGSNDYTESDAANGEITFTYNPASGSTILITYQQSLSVVGNADTVDGLHASDLTSTGWVVGETPTGTINGVNTTFTLSQSYVVGSMQVFRDGQLMEEIGDYTETTPASGIFDFVTAPVTGSVITVSYKHATPVGGLNADTLDGYEASTILNSFSNNLFQNVLINGNMDVWQRNILFTAASTPINNNDTYLIDRWNNLSDGADIVDVSRSTDKPDGSAYSAKFLVATANSKFGMVQIIENRDALKLDNKTVSVSFQAKTTTAKLIENLRIAVLSWNGAADTVTSDVVSAWGAEGVNPTWAANWIEENVAVNIPITTSWVKYSVEGIDIDTANMANIAVVIWVDDTDPAVNDELFITQVQLNEGPLAIDFQPPFFQDEWEKCMRFYEKSWAYGTFLPTTTQIGQQAENSHGSAQSSRWTVGYSVRKWKDSACSVYSPTSGDINKIMNSGLTEFTATVDALSSNDRSFVAYPTENLTDNTIYLFHWKSEIEL